MGIPIHILFTSSNLLHFSIISQFNGTASIISVPGESGDYLTIALKDGGAAVSMTLAKGRLDLHIKPARVRFDDNQWHKIIVHRRVQEVSNASQS